MPNNIHDLAGYQFIREEKFFIDANVWLYLEPWSGSASRKLTDLYSNALKKMLNSGVKIYLNASVLSEYLNRYARLEMEAYNRTPKQADYYKNFKEYRKSPHYPPVAKRANKSALTIIRLCTLIDTPFACYDIAQIMDDHAKCKSDFNDTVFAETCRHHGCKLVTHDTDFPAVDYGLDILTHHSGLLSTS